jgi:hypothetical protein
VQALYARFLTERMHDGYRPSMSAWMLGTAPSVGTRSPTDGRARAHERPVVQDDGDEAGVAG